MSECASTYYEGKGWFLFRYWIIQCKKEKISCNWFLSHARQKFISRSLHIPISALTRVLLSSPMSCPSVGVVFGTVDLIRWITRKRRWKKRTLVDDFTSHARILNVLIHGNEKENLSSSIVVLKHKWTKMHYFCVHRCQERKIGGMKAKLKSFLWNKCTMDGWAMDFVHSVPCVVDLNMTCTQSCCCCYSTHTLKELSVK